MKSLCHKILTWYGFKTRFNPSESRMQIMAMERDEVAKSTCARYCNPTYKTGTAIICQINCDI